MFRVGALFYKSPWQWFLNRLSYYRFLLLGPPRKQGSRQLLAPGEKKNEDDGEELKKDERLTQSALFHQAFLLKEENNLVNRYQQRGCMELFCFERAHPVPSSKSFSLPKGYYRRCYGCGRNVTRMHANYIFSCLDCGRLFQENRHFSTPQHGKVAVVIGARTKLGHQVVLKLLLAGATVIATTRYPDKMRALFDSYPEDTFSRDRLWIYPGGLDLDCSDLASKAAVFATWIREECKLSCVDIYVHCAAQTIRCREKRLATATAAQQTTGTNKYGDPKFVASTMTNSWQMKLPDLVQDEMEEILRVNVVAPTLLIQTLLPLFQACKKSPYIINVHAREGLLSVKKTPYHMHTNFGKSGLHMLTKCLIAHEFHTKSGAPFRIHGCCPGFISIDEYFEDSRPWIVPPLDEVDGAARVLFPLFQGYKSEWKTRRHFHQLII